MRYHSTRDPEVCLEASQVISQGISEEGGLFIPESFPDLSGMFSSLASLSYCELAQVIFEKFLTDFTKEEISECVQKAYASDKFKGNAPVKLVPFTKSGASCYLLELWHGPTCAFKDMALQILPHFLTASLKKSALGKKAVILTATSGDTGKAALEGFRDVPGTSIIVFYPEDGVSPMQKRQMVTQEGNNVSVCAIKGNFDDAQSTVKQLFTDPLMKHRLSENGMMFSSANSINWGRLLPQIVYYFYAYFDLFRSGAITSLNDPINIVVPTGNFGNILAAYYASRMGLPVKKFICASNANKVLTDFIHTGVYDRRRDFYATSSPSMDILISSNLERLLYALSGENSLLLSQWMKDLSETGFYCVGPEITTKIQTLFYGGFCDNAGTAETIRSAMSLEGYLCDPHTAVALNVYRQYLEDTGDKNTPAVVASTASPYKFAESVLNAVEPLSYQDDEYACLSRLEQVSHMKAQEQLRSLWGKPERFHTSILKEEAGSFVCSTLHLGGC